jgi:hypothetical protein
MEQLTLDGKKACEPPEELRKEGVGDVRPRVVVWRLDAAHWSVAPFLTRTVIMWLGPRIMVCEKERALITLPAMGLASLKEVTADTG